MNASSSQYNGHHPTARKRGIYTYEYETKTSLELDKISLETTLGQLFEYPLVIKMLEEMSPGMTSYPMMLKKFGFVKTIRIAVGLGIIAGVIRFFDPTDWTILLLLSPFGVFANIPWMMSVGVLINNTVEYNEYKHGERVVGLTNSIANFFGKLGVALGAAAIGWVLGFAGYDAALPYQADSTITAIIALSLHIPVAISVILFLVIGKYKPLEETHSGIVKELEKRKSAAA